MHSAGSRYRLLSYIRFHRNASLRRSWLDSAVDTKNMQYKDVKDVDVYVTVAQSGLAGA